MLPRVCSSRNEYVGLLTAVDERQRIVLDAQERFNSLPTELRLTDAGKDELQGAVAGAR